MIVIKITLSLKTDHNSLHLEIFLLCVVRSVVLLALSDY
jgi:hypothetical protein